MLHVCDACYSLKKGTICCAVSLLRRPQQRPRHGLCVVDHRLRLHHRRSRGIHPVGTKGHLALASTRLRFVGLQNSGRCQRRNSGLFSMQICVVLECVSDVRIRHAFLTPTWTNVVSIRCFSNSGVRAVFERHSNTVHSFCQKSASLFFELAFRRGMQGRCCKH